MAPSMVRRDGERTLFSSGLFGMLGIDNFDSTHLRALSK